jgi:WD40 repeat protein
MLQRVYMHRQCRLLQRQIGRLRICTRGLFFEGDDSKFPVIKLPYRSMPGKPIALSSWPHHSASPEILLSLETDALNPKDGIILQVTQSVELKAGNLVAPYVVRVFEESPLLGPSSTVVDKRKSVAVKSLSSAVSRDVDVGAHILNRATFVLLTVHSPVAQPLKLCQQLWVIQQACIAQPSAFERTAIEPVIMPRREGPFNKALVGDYRERPLLPATPTAISVERIFPMVTCPGRIMLTERAVYFQPSLINNVAGSDPVAMWNLRDIKRVLRRARLLRETGLELILQDSAITSASGTSMEVLAAGLKPESPSGASVFFAFNSPKERTAVYQEILAALKEARKSSLHPVEDDDLGDISSDRLLVATRMWQQRMMSNLEYLEFLNLVAGRTYADLTQYPVMPWIIQDYSSRKLDLGNPGTFRDLSKPIGALNPSRLEALLERFTEMPRGVGCEPPFLYGTHYSTPGYCLYYLVRSMPEQMLHLQSGKFDAPDRLFFDVANVWAGVTSLNMDVKELIPEFYKSDGSFLLIPEGLDLGVRQNGRRVGDVALPAWAYDVGDFIQQLREALECDYVSDRLHLWVDLIFGCKQRGAQAEAANNVFYYLTYDGAIDVEGIDNPTRRFAVQQQIAEFGQTPRQIFLDPHPVRTGPLVPLPLSATRADPQVNLAPKLSSACNIVPSFNPGQPTETTSDTPSSLEADATSEAGCTSMLPGESFPCALERWKEIVWTPLHFVHGTEATSSQSESIHSDWVMRILATAEVSESEGGEYESLHLLTGSRDGQLKALSIDVTESFLPVEDGIAFDASVTRRCAITPAFAGPTSLLNQFLLLFTAVHTHTAPLPISCLAPTEDGNMNFCGAWDGNVYVCDVAAGECIQTIRHHTAPISSMALVPIASVAGTKRCVLAVASWDTSVSVWIVELDLISRKVLVAEHPTATLLVHTAQVTCMAATISSKRGFVDIVSGDASGKIIWHQISSTTAADAMSLIVELQGINAELSEDAAAAKGDMTVGGLCGITDIAWMRPSTNASICVASSVTGKLLVLRCARVESQLGSTSLLQSLGLIATGEVIRSVAATFDGACVITGGNDGCVRMWSVGPIMLLDASGKDNDTMSAQLTRSEALLASLSIADETVTYGEIVQQCQDDEETGFQPDSSASGPSGFRRARTSLRHVPEDASDTDAPKQSAMVPWATCISILQLTPLKSVILAGTRTGRLVGWTGLPRSVVEAHHATNFGESLSMSMSRR